ncbi:MAG: hypothetical protein HY015_03310 [Bacteroidetes bacterium]|nr:hypothetical protein [Bacteroidota bacterium]MBI3481995.1 hypothetical protein [Bacteroidota bacterium]
MSKPVRDEKMFTNELSIYNKHKDFVSIENSHQELKVAHEKLTNDYKKLLEQARFLTWISGRLEKKLHKANRELLERNTKLEKTVDELMTAKAGKNAYAIIYFIAIILFVLEEFLIEPVINQFGNGVGYSILIKLIIVLLLKVSEGFIEDRIKKKPKVDAVKPLTLQRA